MAHITAEFSQPSSHRRAVLFCCDAGYLPFSLHAATQIAELHPNRDFDICIVTMEDLRIPDSLSSYRFRLIKIDTGGTFANLRRDKRRTESVYLRLALPEVLGGDYDQLLYLDGDIHVDSGDFRALTRLDLGGRAIAAVRDTMQWRTPDRRHEQYRRLGWDAAPYFNSGVMLIDPAAWKAAELTEKCVAFGTENKDILVGHDQTLLNCVLRGDWAELSPVWNWQMTKSARLFATMAPVHIAHFIGPAKPWRDSARELPPRYSASLSRFLSEHQPDYAPLPTDHMPAAQVPMMRKMFARNFLAARRMARYLDRFPTDMTVR